MKGELLCALLKQEDAEKKELGLIDYWKIVMCITEKRRCKKKKRELELIDSKKIIIIILIKKTKENIAFHLPISTQCFVLILSFIYPIFNVAFYFYLLVIIVATGWPRLKE